VRSGLEAAKRIAAGVVSKLAKITALGARCIHHGNEVVHLDLERRDVTGGEPVGASPPPAVGVDHAREFPESAQESREVRTLPVHVDVGGVPLAVHEIDRAVAEHLISERDVAVPGVLGLRAVFHPATTL